MKRWGTAYIDHFGVDCLQFLVADAFSRPEKRSEPKNEAPPSDSLFLLCRRKMNVHPKMFPPLFRIHPRVALVGNDNIYTATNDGKAFLEYRKFFFPRQIVRPGLESTLRTGASSVAAVNKTRREACSRAAA